jgi:RNA polymerase sigma-70 factor (ECF subfamily)
VTETEPILTYRPLLFAIAYRMLASVADAEDAVQETFLRWHRALADGVVVESPKAWLSAVITRLCIDQLRSARVQREQYLGPWLPEPLATREEPDVADTALLNESLSTAFLLLLETLSPKERAVFLLHDVFAYGYAEIAAIVGESETYCRQLARRARDHLAARRPRFPVSPADQEHLTRRFIDATVTGDLSALVATLASDVTLWSDGGPNARAARRPIHGADKVARFLLGISRHVPPGTVIGVELVNGWPAIVARLDGHPITVVSLESTAGVIHGVYIVSNPDKFHGVPPA